MQDGRIHTIVKLYKEEMSIYVPKVPIKTDYCQPNILHPSQDWSVDWIEKSINRTHRILKDYILTNDFTHFFTLTISPDYCDRYDDTLVQTKVKIWLNNIRRHSSLGYIVVPERHKDGALHFHGVMTDPTTLNLYDSGHTDSSGRIIYHTKAYKMGFHDFTEIGDINAVSQYVRKYLSKQFYSREKFKKRFWASRNLKKPEIIHNVDISDLPLEILDDVEFGFYGRFML